MKSVDIVYSGWVNAPNGASTFVRELKNADAFFKAEGVDLAIFSKDNFVSKSFDDQLKIQKKGCLKSRLIALSRNSVLLTWLLLYILYIRHSKFIVKKYSESIDKKADVLFFQEIFTCYYYLKYRTNKSAKVYLTCHDDGDIWEMFFILFPKFRGKIFRPFRDRITKKLLSCVDKFGFVADSARKNFCLLNSNYPEEKTYFIYNGIPDIHSKVVKGKKDDRITLICVGTLCERKNQIGILKAFELLSINVQNKYTLILVGDGEDRKMLEEYSKKIYSNIVFIGNTNKVDEYLKKADCFILFSKNEGLPISIIEAMRSGLPVISTKIAGIPEMIEDGVSGYLVDVDIRDLSKLLLRLSIDIPNFSQMGDKSRQVYLEKFTKEQMLVSFSKLFLI